MPRKLFSWRASHHDCSNAHLRAVVYILCLVAALWLHRPLLLSPLANHPTCPLKLILLAIHSLFIIGLDLITVQTLKSLPPGLESSIPASVVIFYLLGVGLFDTVCGPLLLCLPLQACCLCLRSLPGSLPLVGIALLEFIHLCSHHVLAFLLACSTTSSLSLSAGLPPPPPPPRSFPFLLLLSYLHFPIPSRSLVSLHCVHLVKPNPGQPVYLSAYAQVTARENSQPSSLVLP